MHILICGLIAASRYRVRRSSCIGRHNTLACSCPTARIHLQSTITKRNPIQQTILSGLPLETRSRNLGIMKPEAVRGSYILGDPTFRNPAAPHAATTRRPNTHWRCLVGFRARLPSSRVILASSSIHLRFMFFWSFSFWTHHSRLYILARILLSSYKERCLNFRAYGYSDTEHRAALVQRKPHHIRQLDLEFLHSPPICCLQGVNFSVNGLGPQTGAIMSPIAQSPPVRKILASSVSRTELARDITNLRPPSHSYSFALLWVRCIKPLSIRSASKSQIVRTYLVRLNRPTHDQRSLPVDSYCPYTTLGLPSLPRTCYGLIASGRIKPLSVWREGHYLLPGQSSCGRNISSFAKLLRLSLCLASLLRVTQPQIPGPDGLLPPCGVDPYKPDGCVRSRGVGLGPAGPASGLTLYHLLFAIGCTKTQGTLTCSAEYFLPTAASMAGNPPSSLEDLGPPSHALLGLAPKPTWGRPPSSPAAQFHSLAFMQSAPAVAPEPDGEGRWSAASPSAPSSRMAASPQFDARRLPQSGLSLRSSASPNSASGAQPDALAHEEAIWTSLSHEHILPLFALLRDAAVPPPARSTTLMRAGVPAREDAGRMFRQIVRGLRYLHTEKRLIHRDVKLENVLMDEAGVCRIADFGMARYMDEAEEQPAREGLPIPLGPGTVHRTVSLAVASSAGRTHARRERPATTTTEEFQPGSLPYAAPELLGPPPLTSSTSMTGKTKAAAIAGKSNSAFVSHPKSSSATPIAHSRNPAPAQDIWALGVLLYALLMGRLPFVDSFEPRLVLKILGGTYTPPTNVNARTLAILHGCLAPRVADRWVVERVDEARGVSVRQLQRQWRRRATRNRGRRARRKARAPLVPAGGRERALDRGRPAAARRAERSSSRAPYSNMARTYSASAAREGSASRARSRRRRSRERDNYDDDGDDYDEYQHGGGGVVDEQHDLDHGRRRKVRSSSRAPAPYSVRAHVLIPTRSRSAGAGVGGEAAVGAGAGSRSRSPGPLTPPPPPPASFARAGACRLQGDWAGVPVGDGEGCRGWESTWSGRWVTQRRGRGRGVGGGAVVVASESDGVQ
ncbi:hypothetical protein B0H14DRAFT_2568156 [Mycena olivaceomarginata]|nr:hypothetical protein B0H14DRAFT_2568156 [Mycena olivaceomarginata]